MTKTILPVPDHTHSKGWCEGCERQLAKEACLRLAASACFWVDG